jgi:hypothetical protein
MAADGGASLIDMHGGADNADVDFNVRLLCAGNQLQITVTSGVLISGNFSVSGPVTDSNAFGFFNRPDIYFQGLTGSRGNGSGFDQTMNVFFTANKTQVWYELTVMAAVLDGSGTSNEDVIVIKPALWQNGQRSLHATRRGNLPYDGAVHFRRGQNIYQTKGQLFSVTPGQSYTPAAIESFISMNENFFIHYSHLTIRELWPEHYEAKKMYVRIHQYIMVAIATLLPGCSYASGTFTVPVSALNAALINDMTASDSAEKLIYYRAHNLWGHTAKLYAVQQPIRDRSGR